jgi:predicted RNase H-like nuclease (RuvC/YqgF family)
MGKTNWQLAQEENINGYADHLTNVIKEQRDIIDNLIIKCEEIRTTYLKEVKYKTAAVELNNYVDYLINQIKEHGDIFDNLIVKCEEIRINILKEIK